MAFRYVLTARCEDGTVYWIGNLFGGWSFEIAGAEIILNKANAEAIARDLNYKREDWLGPISVRNIGEGR